MTSIVVFGEDPTNWQMIHESAEDFEESAVLLCKLIKQNDVRIGKIGRKKRVKSGR